MTVCFFHLLRFFFPVFVPMIKHSHQQTNMTKERMGLSTGIMVKAGF